MSLVGFDGARSRPPVRIARSGVTQGYVFPANFLIAAFIDEAASS
jgi:hypothetical protein